MKMRLLVAAANIGFIFLLLVGIAAEAAEIKVLSYGGIRQVMEDLGPKFERASGHKLAITFGSLPPRVTNVRKRPLVSQYAERPLRRKLIYHLAPSGSL